MYAISVETRESDPMRNTEHKNRWTPLEKNWENRRETVQFFKTKCEVGVSHDTSTIIN